MKTWDDKSEEGAVAVTRRTERFAQLAGEVEAQCARNGVEVDPDVVDLVLNERIAVVASVMRIGERAAFSYCPDDLAPRVAAAIVEATQLTPAVDDERAR